MLSRQNRALLMAGAIAAVAATPAAAGSPEFAGEQLAQAQIQTQSAAGIRADKLVGANVRNAEGDAVGEVESVIIGEDGRVRAIVVSVGGFLGMGEREVALDWREVRPVGDSGDIAVAMSKDELKALPKYEYAEDRRRGEVYRDPNYNLAGERQVPLSPVAMTQTRNPDTVPAGSPAVARPVGQTVEPGRIEASTLLGAPVINPRGETIGEVRDLITEAAGNREVVVATGAVLGLGGREVKLALDNLQLRRAPDDASKVSLVVTLTAEQLASLPAYEKTY